MSQGNAADRILEQIARERPGIAWRGEEANLGATVCVDAIGFQARDPRDYAIEHPTAVIDDLARIVAPKGRLSIIGVFLDSDPLAHGKEAQRGEYVIPWGTLFKKGVTIGMGRDDDENYNDHLRDMIVAGRMKPSQIVSHRLPLRDAADAFAKFDARSDGYIKVVLEP
jgi:glutathione-independent formaldehyde dehydrogenase